MQLKETYKETKLSQTEDNQQNLSLNISETAYRTLLKICLQILNHQCLFNLHCTKNEVFRLGFLQ